ncbi:hypothetical protein BJ085DRAFT_36347 [Dimargaris cristalligena]|uniref:Uncharacterized protein n=1 Tax=Dimargaris cristalligena TaxID=215637 RepID=A0A4P9ZP27_9FUNG|nr:hypothetical protein BJ085DRAFT_36347 [Dimargaris cristalligena]|eukprot:RKP34302.1 hypothetical protein BJ085DRAFT_36347 [Dimargaris cristalligena]
MPTCECLVEQAQGVLLTLAELLEQDLSLGENYVVIHETILNTASVVPPVKFLNAVSFFILYQLDNDSLCTELGTSINVPCMTIEYDAGVDLTKMQADIGNSSLLWSDVVNMYPDLQDHPTDTATGSSNLARRDAGNASTSPVDSNSPPSTETTGVDSMPEPDTLTSNGADDHHTPGDSVSTPGDTTPSLEPVDSTGDHPMDNPDLVRRFYFRAQLMVDGQAVEGTPITVHTQIIIGSVFGGVFLVLLMGCGIRLRRTIVRQRNLELQKQAGQKAFRKRERAREKSKRPIRSPKISNADTVSTFADIELVVEK